MFYADMLKSENVIFPPVASFSQSLTQIIEIEYFEYFRTAWFLFLLTN